MNSTTESASGIVNGSSRELSIGLAIGGIVLTSAFFIVKEFSNRKSKNNNDGCDEDKKVESLLKLPVAPPGSKFVTLPESGIKLRYNDVQNYSAVDDSKKATTFLLLHGFGGVVETWEFLTPYLLGNDDKNDGDAAADEIKMDGNPVRVVALDLVGSGYSDKPEASDEFDYSYRQQGTIVTEFISTLKLTNVVVVGHSSGTVVAASTVLQSNYSDIRKNINNDDDNVVTGAVFVANALFRPKSEYFSKTWLKPLYRWMATKMMVNRKKSMARMHLPINADRVLTDSFVENFTKPIQLPGFIEAVVATVMAKEEPYENLVDELLEKISASTTTVPVPLLFVEGADDTYGPKDFKEKIQQKLDDSMSNNNNTAKQQQPRVNMIDLKDCNHYAQHEQPKALAEEIFSFVCRREQVGEN